MERYTPIVYEIAEQLQETKDAPLRSIALIVELRGEDFARDMLAQALEVQANGGMMTNNGLTRRSLGGVFFYLAKGYMSKDERRKISPPSRQRRKRSEAHKRRQAVLAAAMPPDTYREYRDLKASETQYQRKISLAQDREYDGDLEQDRQILVDVQRRINTIEKKYSHIFQGNSSKKGRG